MKTATQVIGLVTLAFGLGCSDDGDPTTIPLTSGGSSGAAGNAPGSGGGTLKGGTGGGGSAGMGAPAGGQSSGGATANGAGTGGAQNGGAPGGGAGSSSLAGSGSPGGSANGQGGTTAGASNEGGQPPGGSGGSSGSAVDAGSSNGGSGGPAGAGGMAGNVGTGGQGPIDITTVTPSCPGAVPGGVTASWCSCEQWGEKTVGDHTYYNDIWGTGPGPQCIWLTDSGMWGVTSNHPNTGGLKAYPNVSLSPKKAISSINTYTSSFEVIVPPGGVYDAAYDFWVKGTTDARIEIMLWMNYRGGTQPIAKAYDGNGAVADMTNVTIGGHTWNVYFGTNGGNDVASFLRTSMTTSATVDIKAMLLWIIANNSTNFARFTTDYTLDQVQFGSEITSDGANQAFVVKNFTVTSN